MPKIELAAETIFQIFTIPVTNTLIMSILVTGILIALGLFVKSRIRLVPSSLQLTFEIFIEGAFGMLESIFGDRKKTEKYFALIASIFIFILFSNWLGLLPGVGSIGFFQTHNGAETFIPLFRGSATDLNFTLAFALMSVVFTHIVGVLTIGPIKHASKFLSFKSPLAFFVSVLEFISEFGKLISFTFRLFGNIFAGEVILALAFFFLPYIVPVPFFIFEVFVGFMQAFIFAMLTAVFISMSTVEHS